MWVTRSPCHRVTLSSLLRFELLHDFRDALGIVAGGLDLVDGGDGAGLVDDHGPAGDGDAARGLALGAGGVDGRRVAALLTGTPNSLATSPFSSASSVKG